MIEIVYNEETEENTGGEGGFHLPKNIRQIGESDKNKKIYIEDYAITYVNQFCAANMEKPRVMILLGNVHRLEGKQYIFINSVMGLENFEADMVHISFTEEVWSEIYGKMKQFFEQEEIVGWCISTPGFPLDISDTIYRAHMNHFPGNDKVLLMREPVEKEEAFFLFEGGKLTKQTGYYIYYEKNIRMQEYMIYQNQGRSTEKEVEGADRAVQGFRKIIEEKRTNSSKHVMAFMYGASTFLVLTVIAIGITMINNYDKMKSMETTLARLTQSIETDGVIAANGKSKIPVETVKGNINPSSTGETAAPIKNTTAETNQDTVSESQPASDLNETKALETTVQETPAETTAPETDAPPPPETPAAEGEGDQGNFETYQIQDGDTLFGISKKFYGTSKMASKICELNGIDDFNKVFPGQNILLP